MATISFWARGDRSSANNASLNVESTSKIAATQITFTSGNSGDLALDYNSGGFDPDTQVIVGGTTYDFTLQFTGTLPTNNKTASIGGENLGGKQIAVLTLSNGQRYFFLVDGSGSQTVMQAFPNGAMPIGNVDNTHSILLCFVTGTRIATPDGERAVETLKPGDLVTTTDGRTVPVLWTGGFEVSQAELTFRPHMRPVVIPAHSFGQGRPARDLWLSPQHRVLFDDWQVGLLFGCDDVLVPANHLVAGPARVAAPAGPVGYHHILLAAHDMVLSEGLPTESLQPGAAMKARMGEDIGDELDLRLPGLGELAFTRPDHARTLRRHETEVLLARLMRRAA